MADFGYCADCNEICYSLPTKNGVFTQANVSFNHQNCLGYMNFDKPPKHYPPPIAQVLKKLNAGIEVSHNEIVLLKLAMNLHGFLDRRATHDGEAIRRNDGEGFRQSAGAASESDNAGK